MLKRKLCFAIVQLPISSNCSQQLSSVSHNPMQASPQRRLLTRACTEQPRPLLTVHELVTDLQLRLDHATIPSYRVWLKALLRGETNCRGVKMPQVRTITKDWVSKHHLGHGAGTDDAILIKTCFESDMTEDKLAAMFYIWDTLQSKRLFSLGRLGELENLFERNLIRPWTVVDSLSIRVLQRLLTQYGHEAKNRIAAWRQAENVWQARASVVAFIHQARDPEYRDVIEEVCGTVIQRPERFAKSGVGWMMREMSRFHQHAVVEFIDHHINSFSLESIRNATKQFSPDLRERYIAAVKYNHRSEKACA